MLKNLLTWAIAHPESALLYATLILSIPGVIYAAVKTAVQKVTGRPAKGGAWTVMDVVIETLPNLPGAINRLVRAGGAPSIFAAPPATPPSPSKVPPAIPPQGGFARLGAVALILATALVLAGLGAVLSGCPSPRLPVVEGCTVGASRCREDRPQVCSSTGRWHDVGDLACAASGAVCVEGGDGGVAHCGLSLPANPYADGGAL